MKSSCSSLMLRSHCRQPWAAGTQQSRDTSINSISPLSLWLFPVVFHAVQALKQPNITVTRHTAVVITFSNALPATGTFTATTGHAF